MVQFANHQRFVADEYTDKNMEGNKKANQNMNCEDSSSFTANVTATADREIEAEETQSREKNGEDNNDDEETKKRIERRRYLDRLAWKRKQRRAKDKLELLTNQQMDLSGKNLKLIKENRGLKQLVLQMKDPSQQKQLLPKIHVIMQQTQKEHVQHLEPEQQQEQQQQQKHQHQKLVARASFPVANIPATTSAAAVAAAPPPVTNVCSNISLPLQELQYQLLCGGGLGSNTVAQHMLHLLLQNKQQQNGQQQQQQQQQNLILQQLGPHISPAAASLAVSLMGATNGSAIHNGVGAGMGVGYPHNLTSLVQNSPPCSLSLQQLACTNFAPPFHATEQWQRQQQQFVHDLKQTQSDKGKDLVDLLKLCSNKNPMFAPNDLMLKQQQEQEQQQQQQQQQQQNTSDNLLNLLPFSANNSNTIQQTIDRCQQEEQDEWQQELKALRKS